MPRTEMKREENAQVAIAWSENQKRPKVTMQDRGIIGNCPVTMSFSIPSNSEEKNARVLQTIKEEEIARALKQSFIILENKIFRDKRIRKQGTTALVAVLHQGKLIFASIGDSPLLLFHYNKKDQLKKTRILNRSDNLSDRKNRELFGTFLVATDENGSQYYSDKPDGKPLIYRERGGAWRNLGGINMARCLGDIDVKSYYQKVGYLHLVNTEPETKIERFEMNADERIVIVAATDGIDPVIDFKGRDKNDSVLKSHLQTPDQLGVFSSSKNLVEKLKQHAIRAGSIDDIMVTAVVMPPASTKETKNHEEKKAEQSSILWGVFDGHVGEGAANFCREKFQETFNQELRKIQLARFFLAYASKENSKITKDNIHAFIQENQITSDELNYILYEAVSHFSVSTIKLLLSLKMSKEYEINLFWMPQIGSKTAYELTVNSPLLQRIIYPYFSIETQLSLEELNKRKLLSFIRSHYPTYEEKVSHLSLENQQKLWNVLSKYSIDFNLDDLLTVIRMHDNNEAIYWNGRGQDFEMSCYCTCFERLYGRNFFSLYEEKKIQDSRKKSQSETTLKLLARGIIQELVSERRFANPSSESIDQKKCRVTANIIKFLSKKSECPTRQALKTSNVFLKYLLEELRRSQYDYLRTQQGSRFVCFNSNGEFSQTSASWSENILAAFTAKMLLNMYQEEHLKDQDIQEKKEAPPREGWHTSQKRLHLTAQSFCREHHLIGHLPWYAVKYKDPTSSKIAEIFGQYQQPVAIAKLQQKLNELTEKAQRKERIVNSPQAATACCTVTCFDSHIALSC